MNDGLDLRLVPAAGLAWLGAALAVAASARAVLATALAAVLAAAVLGRWRGGRATGRNTAALALLSTAVVLVSCAVQLELRNRGDLDELARRGATVTVEAVVRSEPTPLASRPAGGQGPDAKRWGDQERVRAVLDVSRVTGRGRTGTSHARLVVLGGPEWATVEYGSTVRAAGRLVATDPGERAVGLLMAHRFEQVGAARGVDRVVERFRSALLDVTDGLPPDARGLVPGAAIGDTRRLPADLELAMRHTGLTHITAVSGGHFSVLAVTTLGLTGLLRLPVPVRALVAATVMGGFVLLVHPEPSVVRAAGMGALGMVALLAGRPSRAVAALATAVVVLLVLDPWLARAYGFVLSVLATGAIVLLAPRLAARLGAVPRPVALVLAVPTAAQAVCGPVLVLLDPAVLLYAVPANALAAPALLPATVLGTLATVLAPSWPEVAAVPAHGAAAATWWIAVVARGCAALPAAHTAWPGGWGGAALLAVLTAAAVAVVLHPPRVRRRRLLALALPVLLLLSPVRDGLLARLPQPGLPADWDAVVCDVGQGDALVVRSGPRAVVMVDVGPDDGSAARCLAALGVQRIDLLVLTHPHADHVGGLGAVLAGREVRRAVVSPVATPGTQEERVLATLEGAGVPVTVAAVGGPEVEPDDRSTPTGAQDGGPGVPIASGGGTSGTVRWEVLGPSRPPRVDGAAGPAEVESSAVNDASVVLLLDTGDLRVLALGDVEPAAQEDLLALLRAQGRERPAEVVKVAHHGSAHQSPGLARHLAPAVAVVSAGADNTYGHPAPRTVELYREVGAQVLSTHTCGRLALTGEAGGVRIRSSCPAGTDP